MNKTRLAIVDDHQIVIDGLLSLLRGHADFEVLHTCTDPLKIAALLEEKPVDILLTDVMMPPCNGDELARELKKKFPALRILALSMSGQGEVINRMIEEADISGYVLKNIGQQELLRALRKIAAGGIYFGEEVMEEMLRESNRKKNRDAAHLTERELGIIRLIEKEYSNKQIAEALFISERTVETHRKNIFRKTQTSSVIGLIKYAYEHRLIS